MDDRFDWVSSHELDLCWEEEFDNGDDDDYDVITVNHL